MKQFLDKCYNGFMIIIKTIVLCLLAYMLMKLFYELLLVVVGIGMFLGVCYFLGKLKEDIKDYYQ